ncbi:hypothetical protein [Paractinoplanes brasiliensis]|uniref:Beta/gamma crystallin n=1 Tax=Paractinoplanes brasiliensis TaxID=52695 RepID=A0A4R6JZ30_9ACTN|nr:hypothetical protein [Actinoplanes brasiliensis]TDO42039.1 hypothetical protein C8E87_5802 [Actinoplanes brasiliensis]GID33085.1 hypothetical protein Abr02nite_80680 [Actinoplanes brasiliensis]
MRLIAKRTAGLAATLVTALSVTLSASPASAAEPVRNPDTGLVFYSSNPTQVVGRQAAPDDVCRPIPAGATWAIDWYNAFPNGVGGYTTADCSGAPRFYVDSFHSWPANFLLSYRAL